MKRAFDLLSAAVLLLILAIPLAGLALIQLAVLGRPVFFKQERAGRAGRPFKIVKFRTMRIGQGSDAERMTRWGGFLRSTSLDELPELWNVLRGEMSLVGPRPLPVHYLPRYSPAQARRHELRPGITGWAQVNGRNAITWERQFELDAWYVDNRSLGLDLKILLLTAVRVFQRSDISQEGMATRSEFIGTEDREE